MSVVEGDTIDKIINFMPYSDACPHDNCNGCLSYRRTVKGYDKFVCNKCDAVVLNR